MITFTGHIASSVLRKQLITTSTGWLHSLYVYGNNKLVSASRDMTGAQKFIRFNNKEDLTDQTIIAVPYGVDQIIVLNDKAYLCYANAVNDQHLRIGEVDLTTMTLTTVIDEVMLGFYPYQATACTDGTYLYILCAGSVAEIQRYRISDWTKTGNYTATGHYGRGHAIIHDGGFLYATSYQVSTPTGGNPANNWILKLDASTMLVVERNDVSFAGVQTSFSDDMCKVGNYLYIPIEKNTINAGNVMVMNANDLTDYSYITVPEVAAGGLCFGVFYDGNFVYAVFNTTPGLIAKINPLTNTIVATKTLDSGENATNELAFDSKGHCFITYWAVSAKVAKYSRLF